MAMIDVNKNKKLNEELKNLYKDVTEEFLDEYKKAFTEDKNPPTRINEFGIVDTNKYDPDNGILVILKEPNDWSDQDFREGNIYLDFVRAVIEEGANINNGRETSARVKMNMWYNLCRWITAIQHLEKSSEEIAEMYDDVLEALRSMAITNINKVRGYESSGKEYWKIAESNIAIQTVKDEIEILKPKIILCGSTALSLGDDYIDDLRKSGCKVLDLWHPAARKSKTEMIEEVQRQMRKVSEK